MQIEPASTLRPSPRPEPEAEPTGGTKINSDYETFLKLLTTQMSNQDPLNPMKAEEFATQLATFSGVEQQVKTNELLTQLAAQARGTDFAAMTSWIGKEVEAPASAPFDGKPIEVLPGAARIGDVHQIVVRDAAGTERFRATLDGSGDPYLWSGRTHDGTQAGPGLYNFAVESFEGGELIASSTAQVYARVTEVRNGPDGIILGLGHGGEVAASAVSAVREARS